MYGYQPSTLVDRLLPLAGAIANAVDKLKLVSNIRDVVEQLFQISKERMATTRSAKTAPIFQLRDLVYLSTKGLNTRS